jgi:ubiquinone/menaquinone biosynthesis C-methylase UbiE
MKNFRNDPKYLKESQYMTASPLNSRIFLHKKFSTNPIDWHDWVFKRLDLKPDMRVLEVGCGPATLWQANTKLIPSNIQVYLSDFSYGMVNTASNECLMEKGFHFTNCEAQAIPFPEGYFDVVIANHMLYHVPDLQFTFEEIKRVLKKSGKLFAATNGELHMLEIYQLIKKIAPEFMNDKPISQNFSLENGALLLYQHFSVVDCLQYPDTLRITEEKPLTDYIQSFWESFLTQDQLETCAREITKIINHQGVFHVQKSTGLFIAKKA